MATEEHVITANERILNLAQWLAEVAGLPHHVPAQKRPARNRKPAARQTLS